MKGKYILGGGIAGLIAKHFNPEYEIISPDIGGQLTQSKNILITFYIHDDPQMRELLDELKIEYKEKRLKIFYCYKGKVLDNLTNKQKIKLINHKLSEYDYDSNSFDVEDLTLSTQKNYMDILDMDVKELLDKLKPKSIINGKVKLINNNRKFIIIINKEGKLEKLTYDKIISAISANDFFYMMYNYKHSYHFNYLPATFVLSKHRPSFMKEDGIYYVFSDNLMYNRVQSYSNGYIYEVTGFPDDEELNKQIPEILEIERRYIGVLKSEEVDDLKNIKFLGRLSQWSHKILTETVIRKSKEIAKNEQN